MQREPARQRAQGRPIRSEQHRERYQSLWYCMVRKLLLLTKGTLGSLLPPLQTTGSTCQHPEQHHARGANQYGTWVKCLQCGLQLNFTRYGPTNPKPTSKKGRPSAASTPTDASMMRARASQAASASSGDSVVPSRTAGDSLDPRTGDHPEPGADPGPHYPDPAAAPEPDGLHAAPSLVPGPDADRSKSTSDAAGRRHQHGESQHGRVVPPLSSTSTFSLSSTAEKLSSQSHGIDWEAGLSVLFSGFLYSSFTFQQFHTSFGIQGTETGLSLFGRVPFWLMNCVFPICRMTMSFFSQNPKRGPLQQELRQ